MSEDNARGRFVWYDLMTPDPEAAQAFYTAIMGWGTKVWDNPAMPYTMWTAGDRTFGGLMKMPAEAVAGGAKQHWLAYVAVPDTDATVARAQELGAKVMVPPTPIPTVGRFAVIADPHGALIAPFTPDPASAPQGPPPGGDFTWHELATDDYETVFAFYHELFGWEKTSAMDMGPAGVYQMYGIGGIPMGGIYNKPDHMQGPPAWLHYASVKDAAATAEKVKENGGQVLNGPMEVPGGDLIVMIMDPQGGMFAVHEKRSA
ncbi:MAG TPA: VOC family protein [Thermoanaerobaculia bacterium]|nr:VOC family protein [Thermoanaerobaculia bacterium]